MITPIAVALTLYGQQEGRWIPADITPAVLAQRVDKKLATLSKATVKYQYNYDKASVGHAMAVCEGVIVSPTQFFLQLPEMHPDRNKDVALKQRWVADGKHFGKATEPDQPKPGPFSGRAGVPARPLNIWFTDFSHVIFAGLGQNAKPFEKVLDDANSQGYRTSLELRTLTVQGHRRGWYRLIITKGIARYETVFDAAGFVPVSVLNTVGSDSTRWTAVDWNLIPGKALDVSATRFRKPARISKLAPKPVRH